MIVNVEPGFPSRRHSVRLKSLMAIVTYTSEGHGFGVTYDDAWLTHVDDPTDPRLALAWQGHIPSTIAASVLFVPRTATAADVASGRVASQLITSDDLALPPRTLGEWEWESEMKRHSGPFLERTGMAALEATGVYWRGFPVLQLSAVPGPEEEAPTTELPAAPIEVLGMLLTPAQTFSSLMVMPLQDVEEWGERFQTLMDGFYLVPIEREGRVRTGHQFVRSLHVEARDLREDLTAR
jgi:hypothetical protein